MEISEGQTRSTYVPWAASARPSSLVEKGPGEAGLGDHIVDGIPSRGRGRLEGPSHWEKTLLRCGMHEGEVR